MSVPEIRKAVSRCVTSGDAWPPSLPQFVAMGQLLEIDFDEAFSRMLHGRPNGDIEYWACQEVGFACRRYLTEKDARTRYRRALKKYTDKAKTGSLPVRDLMRLKDETNITPVTELKQPEPAAFAKGSVFERVAMMGRRA
ncbi:TPA: hypothetical protein ACGUPM_002676 [Vibrio vulnificus]